MGRAFEYRKARKLKRWGHMARVFTKIGKEIEIAVKSAGPDPSANTRLRILIQNAKAENMPKENIERAIKRATEKDSADYKEVIYEGYGPHGIAGMVETATDNTNRTVANVRMHFSRCGGTLGNSGSVAFLFEHKCVFKFHVPAGTDFEERPGRVRVRTRRRNDRYGRGALGVVRCDPEMARRPELRDRVGRVDPHRYGYQGASRRGA